MKKLFILFLLIINILGCSSIEYGPDWMDHPDVQDPSLTDPDFLVSTRNIPEDQKDFSMPVYICVHGYAASTYAWWEFRDYAEANSNVLVSLVLLGGHGRSLVEFKESKWEDWGKPIMDEYHALVEMGYTNVSLAGSSTGATLILEALGSGKFEGLIPPNEIVLIDPFIVPADGKLKHVIFFSKFIKYSTDKSRTEEEKLHWYTNRPAETLIELKEIADIVRLMLENDGIILPSDTEMTTYKVLDDIKADPSGTQYIENGVHDSSGRNTEIQMLESDKHVFTRGNARDEWSDADRELQLKVFNEMIEKVME